MHAGFAPLLERHRIFQSNDTEEARAFLHSRQFRLEVGSERAPELDMRINGVYLPGMYIGYHQYGPPVVCRTVRRDEYWIQLPVCGRLEIFDAANTIVCDPARAAIASPTRRDCYAVRSGPGCAGIRLRLPRTTLIEQLAALLGETATAPIEFASEMDVTSGHGLTLARSVLMAITDLDNSASILKNPIVVSSFEQFITTGLLLSQPHNLSAVLQRLDKPIAPRDVRRAVEYIEAHLDQAITIADIVKATGVAGRTLFKQFKDFKGVAPMRYVRDARFRQARDALQRAEPEQSVTEIAASWGFVHLGRFSLEYRRRFGESPSQTLKRGRKRARHLPDRH